MHRQNSHRAKCTILGKETKGKRRPSPLLSATLQEAIRLQNLLHLHHGGMNEAFWAKIFKVAVQCLKWILRKPEVYCDTDFFLMAVSGNELIISERTFNVKKKTQNLVIKDVYYMPTIVKKIIMRTCIKLTWPENQCGNVAGKRIEVVRLFRTMAGEMHRCLT